MRLTRQEDNKPERTEPERFLSLREAMNRLFDESFWDPLETISLRPVRGMRSMFPTVDVSETDGEVKVVANVPGVDPDKLDIEVADDTLVLSGKMEREEKEENKDKKYYRLEREYGEFRREILLPAKVSADKVSAKIKNGVLVLTLPKIEQEKKKKIKVEKE